jgi:glycosyltransferase involved in cell wall biosynthesis
MCRVLKERRRCDTEPRAARTRRKRFATGASPHNRRMRVCLSMIVKNEAAVIERCLASVLPHIDAWAICDTGSSDGTQDLIRRRLVHLPGELIERPWVDFATNRNEALDLARRHGDYALVVDADDIVEADSRFTFGAIDAAAYMLEVVPLCRELLGDARLPERERARVARNLELSETSAT